MITRAIAAVSLFKRLYYRELKPPNHELMVDCENWTKMKIICIMQKNIIAINFFDQWYQNICNLLLAWHNDAWTKWLPLYKWHFRILVLEGANAIQSTLLQIMDERRTSDQPQPEPLIIQFTDACVKLNAICLLDSELIIFTWMS